MGASVRFYRDVLGVEIIYGGEEAYFSSLRTKDGKNPILNLEQGKPATEWGRVIFYVVDTDAFWTHLKERGFDPERPRDASWGERYSTCPIRMGMSCRLRIRSSSLSIAAKSRNRRPRAGRRSDGVLQGSD